MFTVILAFILLSPLYLFLILQFNYPKDMMIWAERWKYDTEPDFSDESIKIVKIKAIVGIILLSLLFIFWFISEL
ncbi:MULTISPECIES: hypothetical protein [Sporosarcina]|uniref:Uncharacterized protein n=1 Tax=Sporosarcina saromensis TaxID=359365 RepID=A0ABU4GC12_9BACL|nr:hypothetical protein [Sporosarcina saromensis]MDW0114507.1 hypothetical protein [Sporosarcina saromensis]